MKRTDYLVTDSPAIDQVGVEERISRFSKRSIKKESKMAALKMALSMVDLTTLERLNNFVRKPCIRIRLIRIFLL
jgi:deoxyribose-phosphate aldolase